MFSKGDYVHIINTPIYGTVVSDRLITYYKEPIHVTSIIEEGCYSSQEVRTDLLEIAIPHISNQLYIKGDNFLIRDEFLTGNNKLVLTRFGYLHVNFRKNHGIKCEAWIGIAKGTCFEWEKIE